MIMMLRPISVRPKTCGTAIGPSSKPFSSRRSTSITRVTSTAPATPPDTLAMPPTTCMTITAKVRSKKNSLAENTVWYCAMMMPATAPTPALTTQASRRWLGTLMPMDCAAASFSRAARSSSPGTESR